MIELFGAPGSVFVRKARILLVEKCVDFTATPVNPMQPLKASYYDISPLGKIPALTDGELNIADSSVICAYLDKAYPMPSFYPNDPSLYAKALWFEEYADTKLFTALAPCYYQTILVPLYRNREPDQQAINHALKYSIPPAAKYIEKHLSTTPNPHFLVGNTITIADISVGSVFFNLYQSGYPINATHYPLLSQYLNVLFDRPSFAACVSDIDTEKKQLAEMVIG